jgi:fido (protein-threonine AMPylation protein)
MARSFQRPRTKAELDRLETRGLWQAMALAKEIGESSEKITLAVILRIHKTFFRDSSPEIAGRFRKEEDVKKLKCIEPPPGRAVEARMYQFWRELDSRLAVLPRRPAGQRQSRKRKWLGDVIGIAAWVQHEITAIHPFCEGNGRMARLMTNLILRRFGLQPSQIKYEGENKTRYLDALCQIDHHRDYEPLKKLIAESVHATYQKVYEAQRVHAKEV